MPRRQHLSALTEDPPEADATGREPDPDPLRRAALLTAAVALPVVVVLVLLVQLTGPDDDGPGDDGSPVAEVEGAPTPRRADLPPLSVEVPPATPEADATCPALMAELPLELAGEMSRPVQSATPYAYAWGDPPVVLVCGAAQPAGFELGSQLIEINGVRWFVDLDDPEAIVWTAVDRPVPVQVTVPPETDSAPVTALGPVITATLPFQEPRPAG